MSFPSSFHQEFNFYVQGVGKDTSVLPWGWQVRVVTVCNENTHGATGLCLEPHDLCVAKLIAAREKDHCFVDALVSSGKIELDKLADRLQLIDATVPGWDYAHRWIEARR